MGKTDSTLCFMCEAEIKKVSHLYWECSNNRCLGKTQIIPVRKPKLGSKPKSSRNAKGSAQ